MAEQQSAMVLDELLLSLVSILSADWLAERRSNVQTGSDPAEKNAEGVVNAIRKGIEDPEQRIHVLGILQKVSKTSPDQLRQLFEATADLNRALLKLQIELYLIPTEGNSNLPEKLKLLDEKLICLLTTLMDPNV